MLKELIIDDYGVNLGKKSERMVLRKDGKVIQEYAIKELDDLVIGHKCGMVSISLIEELIQNGTQIHFIDYKHEPFVTAYTPAHHGTVKIRREQLLSYQDERGVHLAKEIIRCKVQNQINLVKYYLKSRKGLDLNEKVEQEIKKMEQEREQITHLQGETVDQIRQSIITHEAHVAKRYWKCVKVFLSEKIQIPGRNHLSNDPFNMMLNYGYSILGSRISSSIIRAGLEPYAGFIHVDRAGRPSLRLDFMEIFRQPFVDQVVISLLSRGHIPGVETSEDGSERLGKTTLSKLREGLFKKLDTHVDYHGKEHLFKTVIQLQARELASYFREGKKYKGYIMRW